MISQSPINSLNFGSSEDNGGINLFSKICGYIEKEKVEKDGYID